MNTRHTPPGGKKPVAKPLGGKPSSGKPVSGEALSSKPHGAKPRDQQEKSTQRKAIAAATGAPKREDAMLAATELRCRSGGAPRAERRI